MSSPFTFVNMGFLALFIFRYLRLFVNIVGWLIYKPCPIPARPSYDPSDCTVIIPTIDPAGADFLECCFSVLLNNPGHLLIVTAGKTNRHITKKIASLLKKTFPETRIKVKTATVANKRHQVALGLKYVKTELVVLVDDHVFWPSQRFLPTAIAPFEDARVGAVGTNKRVRRNVSGWNIQSFFNFLGCVYLERHNFEIRATNALDGGVFVVSGRTSLWRTSILQDPAFLDGFTHEMFLNGTMGPLNADDDNFLTRWIVKHGWDIKIQSSEDAVIETTLGEYPRFLSQCLRWARTTWRSNSCSLFTDGTVWERQPWCVYAVYLSSFVNFALFYDAALLYTLYHHTTFGHHSLAYMAAFILWTKTVKLLPHFWRCPGDVLFFPGYLLFAYYHSLLKLYALATFYETAWSGRNLEAPASSELHALKQLVAKAAQALIQPTPIGS
ncbi:nucleotide-diphospho-sugar transferase [Biscogniauxia mediterranea]|nr:nucleotide-diphospho-sugar transferase [Biscogniauxia mediterranea]